MLDFKHCTSFVFLLVASALCLAQKLQLVVQTGHSGSVELVAFSPDGKTFVSSGNDGVIKLWDVETGAELRAVKAASGLTSIAFSPDGNILASAGTEGKINLWNVFSGAELRSLSATSSISSIAFSPDGKILASAGQEKVIQLWEVSTGAELRTLPGFAQVTSIAFSPDGHLLASAGLDGMVRLWDVSTGTVVRILRHRRRVDSVAFSPVGKIFASASSDGQVRLWDLTNGVELRAVKGFSDSLNSIAFSPDGKTLADGSLTSGGDDKVVKIWEVSTGAELRILRGHPSKNLAVAKVRKEILNSSSGSVAFSPDGKTLASGSFYGTINLWDFATGEELRTFEGHSDQVEALAVSPDGRTLATGSYLGTIKLWDLSTVAELRTLEGHSLQVTSLAFAPDGKTLVSSSGDQTIKIWDISTGVELRTIEESTGVSSVAISPNGKAIATANADNSVRLWDVLTGTELRTFAGHSAQVQSVAFSPNGKIIASGSLDQTIKLWDVSTGVAVRSFETSNAVYSVKFSFDGRYLAGGGEDKVVKLWQLSTGAELRTLKVSTSVYDIAFSRDGKILATGTEDATILWDVSTGRELQILEHSFQLIFTQNDKYLAGAGVDNCIKLWDVGSGKELASLIALDKNDWAVITPEGLFDGSPNAWKKLIWRLDNNTFNFAPIEAFFKEFFYPGLLPEISTGRIPKPTARNVLDVDIRQPSLSFTRVAEQDVQVHASGQPFTVINSVTKRKAQIEIQVTDNIKTPSRSSHPLTSGATDLRLFRNGSLVKFWQGDLFDKRQGECEQIPAGPNQPRRAVCKATISITAGENKLTAYAFNHDNVKSSDSEVIVKGSDSLKRAGTAYIIAIGVNEYANKDYNLRYAVADAEDFGGETKLQQEALKQYDKVEVVPLYDKAATKENILLALKLLSGRAVLSENAPESLQNLKEAQPEDLVIVYFAGHGTARENQFFLIPHDLGYDGSELISSDSVLNLIITHSISDRDLEGLFVNVDAGRLLLVIDACNSGQALEAEEKRRGPMNSKGLAQVAYEKGMYILAASQSNAAALEVSELKHGLLTYVLIEEGLKQAKAEKNSRGEIFERKWFNYATKRVPELQIDQMKRRRQGNQGSNAELVFVEGDDVTTDPEKRKVQRPRVFYRRELEAQPLIVARH